jgi:hypothetical protein
MREFCFRGSLALTQRKHPLTLPSPPVEERVANVPRRSHADAGGRVRGWFMVKASIPSTVVIRIGYAMCRLAALQSWP